MGSGLIFMKNKRLKGLTLIELVIVMAIIGIILTGVLSFFKPIRQVFVDSTVYEQQRNVETGIAEYITENTRYCTNLGIYSRSKVSNRTGAINAFCSLTGLSASDKRIRVITINNTSAYTYKGKTYNGRILMYRYNSNPSVTSLQQYLVFGNAYYGGASYSIAIISPSATSMDIIVSSTQNGATVKTNSSVAFKNLTISGSKFDVSKYSGLSTTSTEDTYIVYTVPN
jgi:prepilin-type N-terminal cleavage/methylation domain-containing protein